MNRCNRPADIRYHQYGGRGIKFLFNDMQEFIECVGPRPSPAHSLDRIDNDGHYVAGNVRWATKEVQTFNKRNSLIVEIGGVEKPLKKWAEEYGQPYKRVWERIKDGQSVIDALQKPAGPQARRYGQAEAAA